MRRPLTSLTAVLGLGLALSATQAGGSASAERLAPGDPAYQQRDAQNVADAYGRQTGPNGQLSNPAYLPALVARNTYTSITQAREQAATPNRIAVTPGNVFPGWNVGNPLRAGWSTTRGRMHRVQFTNRYGALLKGTVYRPRPGARDPYTGRVLRGPFPGVVITTGSVQGSEGMYRWLAEDLAERGYVVLTYDVQGQGRSETLPHPNNNAVPFCNPFAQPSPGEQFACPGVPAQQPSNFVVGTEDALSFFTSTPAHHYRNPHAAGTTVSPNNPYWASFDRSPDPNPTTPGRRLRIAIIGHSLGAAAVSKVQGIDKRVAAVVALDKLVGPGSSGALNGAGNVPVVPALAVQSEYGFTVNPWFLSGGSSLQPQPSPDGPDPRREKRTGYDAWRAAHKNTMLVVPRASTHLDYTDIPLVLPASRFGQDLASHYAQAWLQRYLKHAANLSSLTGPSFRYLEPVGNQRWAPVTLSRARLFSFYYCSAWHLRTGSGLLDDPDVANAGCR